MKKIFVFLISFLLFVSFINAEMFKLSETDLSLNLNESEWYIFTRDNIKDNKELKEFEISEEYMKDVFESNSAYLDALLFINNEDGTNENIIEMFVRINDNDTIKNLTNYPIEFTEDLAKEYKKMYSLADVYTYRNNYNWVVLDHFEDDKYLLEYVTIVNGKNYNISFQSNIEYTEEYKEYIKDIIDDARFDLDDTLEETYDYDSKFNLKNFISNVLKDSLKDIVIYAVVGGLVGGVVGYIRQRKNNKNNEENQSN